MNDRNVSVPNQGNPPEPVELTDNELSQVTGGESIYNDDPQSSGDPLETIRSDG